jgi:predicted alpha/beta-fold hydrolase
MIDSILYWSGVVVLALVPWAALYYWFAPSDITVIGSDSHFRSYVQATCPVISRRYFPSFFAWNGHVMAMIASMLHKVERVTLQRETVHLPDGGVLSLDWVVNDPLNVPSNIRDLKLDSDTSIVLFLHGLVGSSRTNYMQHTLAYLQEHANSLYTGNSNNNNNNNKSKLQMVVMNARGCGDTALSSARGFTAGDTSDVEHVIGLLARRFPSNRRMAVAFSLGANILAKYLGDINQARSSSPSLPASSEHLMTASNANSTPEHRPHQQTQAHGKTHLAQLAARSGDCNVSTKGGAVPRHVDTSVSGEYDSSSSSADSATEQQDGGLVAAAILSNPWDLEETDRHMRSNWLYRAYNRQMTATLQAWFRCHEQRFSESPVVAQDVYAAKTIRMFDKALIVPLYKFRDVEHYYRDSSSIHSLAGVRTPMLALNSLDDPVCPPKALPTKEAIHSNPNVLMVQTTRGSHTAWLQGWNLFKRESWADKVLAEYIVAMTRYKQRNL